MTAIGGILMATLLVVTVVVIIVWAARSPWYKYRAGQSIMALMVAQAVILSLGVISRIFGYDFPHRDAVYSVVYVFLIAIMVWVGVTIVIAQAEDRRSLEKEDVNG